MAVYLRMQTCNYEILLMKQSYGLHHHVYKVSLPCANIFLNLHYAIYQYEHIMHDMLFYVKI